MNGKTLRVISRTALRSEIIFHVSEIDPRPVVYADMPARPVPFTVTASHADFYTAGHPTHVRVDGHGNVTDVHDMLSGWKRAARASRSR